MNREDYIDKNQQFTRMSDYKWIKKEVWNTYFNGYVWRGVRIEELEREYKEAMTAWGADVKELTLSLSQRENRNAELERKLKKVDALVLRLSAGYDWTSLTDDEVALLQEIMDTDRDGVPR